MTEPRFILRRRVPRINPSISRLGRPRHRVEIPETGRFLSERSQCVVAKLAGTCPGVTRQRSEEHTSELQSRSDLVCRLLLEKKKKTYTCISLQHHYTIAATVPLV